ncbi:3',5'-cyclic-AMP phosphodiesterase [Motilimonas eburnea]|uniref:3',5'-cyclic-AMP phosphodiesterase n=1 Tax=Motilimonas eburnea TaxID=1737488 RepID=UPI001E5EF5B8|nr:3',5'-cyclic-AMP phosphodiesterase [Motilimonas eburnea]MCE2573671.1 3',5'-cyclic-AMP phosphodiesterase [Motilimonas eburnea]
MTKIKTQLDVDADGVLTFLQITDTHLFAKPDGELLGVNTRESFLAVIAKVLKQARPIQGILATGDISQDHTPESYRLFAEHINQLEKPCFWLPGNHDFQPAMLAEFATAGISPAKQLVSKYWQVILLDTQELGVPHGRLKQEQLTQLQGFLDEYPDKHALVLLHHHVQPAGCKWLDQHDLKNADELFAMLKQYPQVKALVCGHIHQEMDRQYDQFRLLATPSTCIQFKPHCDDFTLDEQGPGWRYLDLLPNGDINTQVYRLADGRFAGDAKATGY